MRGPLYTDVEMRQALETLAGVRPTHITALARTGPLPEPHCAICLTLLPLIKARRRGFGAALVIVMYHDEATYEVGPDDYLVATGLAGIHCYQRCLRVYEHARKLAPPPTHPPAIAALSAAPQRR